MNFIKSLFLGKKTEEVIPKTVSSITHNIGYDLYTKDGSRSSRFYKDVRYEERIKVREDVHAEINLIESTLNDAIANKKEFVNLSGVVVRVSDFSRLCFFEVEAKE
jgi:hypothetical protein